MKRLFLGLLAVLTLVCQRQEKERADAKNISQIGQAADEDINPTNCCEYSTVTWEQADSIENALPPLNECAATVQEALKNFKLKRTEIRRNESFRKHFGFPENCIFYEYSELKSALPRAIAIVIEKPKFTIDLDDTYTCPSEITGHGFVCGDAYFVLLDPKSRQVLDTCHSIAYEVSARPACREFPFSICKGYSYQSNRGREKEGLAQILAFQDFDRDGLATEFPVFEHGACGFKLTAIIGYNSKRDKIQPLVFNFKVTEEDWQGVRNGLDTTYESFHNWMPNLPLSSFLKKDTIAYWVFAGHGIETGEIFKIWWNSEDGRFDGKLRIVSEKNMFEEGGPFFGTGGLR